ncbi:hypothetical protein MACH09_10570 [Vibrio sp. MACH09]|uniref:helix-turn-helix transcriptional regulator n=1 Tax=Vibrio sp. MACH09 TaxID=3025122 RepID=UPI00278C90B2|nr:LuxR C-terminal-related transcriptional regulator [Vibrio sp. MACH09]GLO60549.1 hypothetical protein MACH09_10570 [Vibrio sp. MACH09]
MKHFYVNEDKLSCELSERLKKVYGFEFSYAVFPKDFGIFNSTRNRDEVNLLKYPIFSTSSKGACVASRLIYMYMSDSRRSTKTPNLVSWLESNFLNALKTGEPHNEYKEEFLLSNQVSSLFSVTVSEHEDDFAGFFFMYSNALKQHDMESKIKNSGLKLQLDTLHFYLTRRYPRVTNPNFYNGSMKERTAEILHLTASGKSCNEIMQIIPLSANGVNYHLDRAKSLLNARNKVELIYNAKQSCFI